MGLRGLCCNSCWFLSGRKDELVSLSLGTVVRKFANRNNYPIDNCDRLAAEFSSSLLRKTLNRSKFKKVKNFIEF